MLHIILDNKKRIVLCTSSQKLSTFITKEIIEKLNYKYSDFLEEDRTITNITNSVEAKQIVDQIKENSIVVSTLEPSIWKELDSNLEVIDLDNLDDSIKFNLIANLVFLNKFLRKGFSSNFWINCLKFLSNNFFEIYLFYKIINSASYNEKIGFNKILITNILSYLEDEFSIENNIDFYPKQKEIETFLYYLINNFRSDNPYKIFNDIDLIERVYMKYKIIYNLSSKDLTNVVINDNPEKVKNILNILGNNISYITSIRNYPKFDSMIENLRIDDQESIYPFSFIFLILDKRVVILRVDDEIMLFEVKSNLTTDFLKSILGRFKIKLEDYIYYKSEQVYTNLLNLLIKSLKSNIELAYNVICTSIMAMDFEYYNNKGFILMLMGSWDEAEKNFKEYLSIDPEDVLVKYNLASLYWLQSQYEKSLNIIESITLNTKKFFSSVVPIYPYLKKNIIYDVDAQYLLKLALSSLLYLVGRKEDALNIISKIPEDKLKYNDGFYSYYLDCKKFIHENSFAKGS